MKKEIGKIKRKLSFSINDKLLEKFDSFLDEEELGNRSKYIEKLIRDDMEKRGKDVSRDF